MPAPTVHVPVMLAEVLTALNPQPGQRLVDGTLGGAGHTAALAQRVTPGGQILALDRDPAALERVAQRIAGLPVQLHLANFADLPQVLEELNWQPVDGVLVDLGLSSDQLADAERGFSFSQSGPLDLRFNPDEGTPAWELLDRLSADQLADLIYQYGEERCSRRVARVIVETRRQQPLRTAEQLAALVRRVVPRSRDRIDPATRTFQALRIAVNDELGSLERLLARLPACVRPGGRVAIISFHSLEDRLVKHALRGSEQWEVLTKKPLRPSDEEVATNPRSRSAKLRVAQRI
jgi:16S rRNA (cytosine1402-N4)-methyltransferase